MRGVPAVAAFLILLAAHGVAAEPAATNGSNMAFIESAFRATEPPVRFGYQVSYRFLKMEISRLGVLTLTTTTGNWRHRVASNDVPAVFVDLRFDSIEHHKPPARDRVSIHDRIVAVIELPEPRALLFAKDTDEYLNPILGRTKISRCVSSYDVQSGALEYWKRDLSTDCVSTNLSDPAAILELSRQIGPVLNYLMAQASGDGAECLSPESLRISANCDGHVVPLRLRTRRDASPPCFDRERLQALRVDVVPSRASDTRVYRFSGWALPFETLADRFGDEATKAAARRAVVKAVVPVAAEYELDIGSIRVSAVSLSSPVAPVPGGAPTGVEAAAR